MKSRSWKLLPLVILIAGSITLHGQSPLRIKSFSHMSKVMITADKMEARVGSVVRYRGSVALETATVLIRADELDFNVDTRQADLRGAVTIRFID